MTTEPRTITALIRRIDADRRIVLTEVYAPNNLDTYGEFMLPEHVEEMAHKFMGLDFVAGVIDTNHDNVPNGCYPLESWICRNPADPDFTEGSWCMSIKVASDAVWDDVVTGKINGVSFEAMVNIVEYDVNVSVVRDHVGQTLLQKGVDHDHLYFCQVDEKGRVQRGMTSPGPDGHVHIIRHATMTETTLNHSHRFDLKD